jgi:hypothetical protein
VDQRDADETRGDASGKSFSMRERIPDPHAFLNGVLLLLEALMPDAAIAQEEVRACRT